MRQDPVKIIPISERVRASIVIPHFYASRDKNVEKIVEQLRQQTFTDVEVLVVSGVSPQGKAINTGVRQSKGEILIVMDDDTEIDQKDLIERLIKVIDEFPDVAMAGASLVSPDNLNSFQEAAGKQFPRFNMPIVKEVTDSDMPCHGCVAFRREVFEQVGMERETILRGLDPDLRVRIREAGYRVVLVPETWLYHPFPETVWKFIRLFFRNGYGSAYTQIYHPEINYDTDEKVDGTDFIAKRSFLYRILRYPVRLFKSIVSLQWIRFLGYGVYLVGYAVGFPKFLFLKHFSPQRAA